ncbi:hypothetical protein DQW50_15025 [Halorubrum sp. 48-1-W]|uniref:hypothetical protein n=1 Tax=Halorubrum sp. 48-1-W TaxID=2249761 RepID=UPI000DCB667E|nr:hypothetical protein [Halorubrum sp. 48-1-W]RAW44303.1 hypothetical protein DQW50_15025 [Halorubrum sp. 48-1-W]
MPHHHRRPAVDFDTCRPFHEEGFVAVGCRVLQLLEREDILLERRDIVRADVRDDLRVGLELVRAVVADPLRDPSIVLFESGRERDQTDPPTSLQSMISAAGRQSSRSTSICRSTLLISSPPETARERR